MGLGKFFVLPLGFLPSSSYLCGMKQGIVMVCLCALICACGQSYEEKRKASHAERQRLDAEERQALKIAVMPTIDGLPLFLASERCWFDTLHADVRLKPYRAQIDCDTAIVGDSVDVLMSDFVRTERLRQQGTPLTYVSTTPIYWQLIANKTARVKETSQLGDKMVGMARFSATDYLTSRSLEGVKTKAQVFRIQLNDIHVRQRMLETNSMDAAWLPEPQATACRKAGHAVVADSRKLGPALGVMAFRQDALKGATRTRQLAALTQAYNRACDSLNHYGLAHYAGIVSKYCGVDERVVASIPPIKFTHVAAPTEAHMEKVRKALKQ